MPDLIIYQEYCLLVHIFAKNIGSMIIHQINAEKTTFSLAILPIFPNLKTMVHYPHESSFIPMQHI